MEVDILSPQMRIRSISGSNKRSRSPGSPSPLERASKRAFISQLSCSVVINQEGVGGGVRRWSPYEDEWVHQTQGMTIHSPALSEGDHLSNRSAEGSEELDEDSRGDVQMTGPEDNTSTPRPHHHPPTSHHIEDSSMTSPTSSRQQQQLGSHSHHSHPNSHLRSLEPDSIDQPSANAALTSLHALLETPRSHRTGTLTNTDSTSHPPRITLHPATPSTPSDGPRLSYALSLSQPSSPPPHADCLAGETPSSPMSVIGEPGSPASSQTPSHSAWRMNCTTGQRRKPFVSMGPRADCEKCRLKLPGHWMHLD